MTPLATGSLTNTATVSADEEDPDSSNNTDSVVTATTVSAAAPALGGVGLVMLLGLLTVSGLFRLRIGSH